MIGPSELPPQQYETLLAETIRRQPENVQKFWEWLNKRIQTAQEQIDYLGTQVLFFTQQNSPDYQIPIAAYQKGILLWQHRYAQASECYQQLYQTFLQFMTTQPELPFLPIQEVLKTGRTVEKYEQIVSTYTNRVAQLTSELVEQIAQAQLEKAVQLTQLEKVTISIERYLGKLSPESLTIVIKLINSAKLETTEDPFLEWSEKLGDFSLLWLSMAKEEFVITVIQIILALYVPNTPFEDAQLKARAEQISAALLKKNSPHYYRTIQKYGSQKLERVVQYLHQSLDFPLK